MAFVAGTGLGGAAGTVLAWQHAREIVEISADLLRREAKISREDRAYRAERELDTLQALRGKRVGEVIESLEDRVDWDVARYSNGAELSEREVALLAALRTYREQNPHEPASPAHASNSSDPADLLASVRILPVFESGAMVGIRVTRIHPGSRRDVLGLRDGDLITAVAGVALDSPDASIELIKAMVSDRPLSLVREAAQRVKLLDAEKRE
jgi:hypothetical protein